MRTEDLLQRICCNNSDVIDANENKTVSSCEDMTLGDIEENNFSWLAQVIITNATSLRTTVSTCLAAILSETVILTTASCVRK